MKLKPEKVRRVGHRTIKKWEGALLSTMPEEGFYPEEDRVRN